MDILKRIALRCIWLVIGCYSFFSAALVQAAPENCKANPEWFSNPSMPVEVAKSGSDGDSNFCDFYQFSWQAFAYLMSKDPSSSKPVLLDDGLFPELEVSTKGEQVNSCDEIDSNGFVIALQNGLPERVGQAGGGDTIYDQEGNVVFYDVRFSKNMCDDFARITNQDNFAETATYYKDGEKSKGLDIGQVVELKAAWKVLTDADNTNDYFVLESEVEGVKRSDLNSPNKCIDTIVGPNCLQLGMVGLHIAVATPDHPEFVWATFEHNVNVPDCNKSGQAQSGWSFTSPACAAEIAGNNDSGNCDFNKPKPETAFTQELGTEICRDYAYGSDSSDHKYTENYDAVTTLNKNVQPNLTGNFSVLKNYFNVGAIWLSDIGPSSDAVVPPSTYSTSNQRGSLRLANSVAETSYQHINPNVTSGFVSNCMGCHSYNGTDDPTSSKNTTLSNGLSHIFAEITQQTGQCYDTQTTKIINSNSQSDKGEICKKACTQNNSPLVWNGEWTNQDVTTGAQLPMTVCGCCSTLK